MLDELGIEMNGVLNGECLFQQFFVQRTPFKPKQKFQDLNPDSANPGAVNKNKNKTAVPAAGANDADADLEARLDALRRQ